MSVLASVAELAALKEASQSHDEVLYKNERTVILRRHLPDGRTVIEKQGLGMEGQRRLRDEVAILERLMGMPGVPRLVKPQETPGVLWLEDDGGQSLAQYLLTQQLSLEQTLAMAIELARVIAAVHRSGIVHKDINPANIIVSGRDLHTVLIDYGIASSFAEERPGFTHQSHIAGTLAYMAPEQTGRTGRAVDQRADLYALGVTLYELTVGRKPFESEDLLELIHDHLVRTPVPPEQAAEGVPPMLSAIIMKLLEKEADKRYQSAEGLGQDLTRLRHVLERGEPASFPLGLDDFPLRLRPPTHLIGRGAEVRILGATLQKSVIGQGRALLISGIPGVGKSALVNELQPIVTGRQGWFVSGKFDQYRQQTESAIVHSLRALGRLILAEPEAELVSCREAIVHALGSNLGFGPCLLPEFALLLGEMPKVDVNDPMEAENRSIQACIDLYRAIASPQHPVVIVVDDLQWAPAISLRVIDALLTSDHDLRGLLLVGTYRANEIDATHPLSAMLARWAHLGVALTMLTVNNLPPADTSTLVGEMLRLSPQDARRLGQTVNERTGGNPYDTVELINALRHDGLLVARDGAWHWDDRAIRRYVGDCDVVGLLNRRVDHLPAQSRTLLETIACLGGEVSMSLLAVATGTAPDVLQAQLVPPLEDGLLVTDNAADRLIHFRHDRVQQALFERMAHTPQGPMRLALARRLVADKRFAPMAAQQYLNAASEIKEAQERRTAAKLFQRAAASNRVVNNKVAEQYLAAALALLIPDEGPDDAPTILSLMIERHAALYGLARHR
jgi:predicted Ser/Thr protein kinase